MHMRSISCIHGLDVENALCCNGVRYGKNISIGGSDLDSMINFNINF